MNNYYRFMSLISINFEVSKKKQNYEQINIRIRQK